MDANIDNTKAKRERVHLGPNPRRALRLERVLERLGVSRSTLYDMISRGLFPAPLKPGTANGASIWLEEWCDAYIDRLIAERDSKAA